MAQRDTRNGRSLLSVRLALLLLFLFAAISVVLAWTYLENERAEAGEVRDARGSAIGAAANGLILDAVAEGEALQALFRSSESVSRDEFRVFVGQPQIPGLVSVGLLRVVTERDRAEFEDRLGAEVPGAFLFDLVDGEEVPSPPRPLHYAVDYVVPFGSGIRWGFDVGSRPESVEVVERALTRSLPTARGLVAFPGETDEDGLAVWLPAMTHDGELDGLIFVAIDLSDVLAAAVPRSLSDEVRVLVVSPGEPIVGPLSDTWIGTLAVADKVWRLEVVATTSTVSTTTVVGVALAATLLAFMLTALVLLSVARWRERKASAALRRASRAKDGFLAAVSHQLRTPLTSVVGFADILRSGVGEMSNAELAEMAGIVLEEAGAMEGIVQDLLVATRLTEGGDVSITIGVVPSVAAEASTVIKTLTLVRDAPFSISGDGAVAADRARLGQILRNLLANALTHGEPPVTVHIEQVEHEVLVAIADAGSGVPDSSVEMLFLDDSADLGDLPTGTGVGLWLSRHLARLMGGDLTHGGGSTFLLTLRAADRAEAVASEVKQLFET